MPIRTSDRRTTPPATSEVPNLNSFAAKNYDNPPKRKPLARFRSHPLKAASMTVALANYDVKRRGAAADGKWRCFVTYGIGKGYEVQPIEPAQLKRIREVVQDSSPKGNLFVKHITNGFTEKIASAKLLQELYESNQAAKGGVLNPQALLEETKKLVFQFADHKASIESPEGLLRRESVPVTQLYALFAVCHIISVANKKGDSSHE